MSYPKIVAMDMDGTVVDHDGVISQRTLDALKLANDKGAHLVFATGRPPRWMQIVRGIPGANIAICGNGAIVYDLGTEKIVHSSLISPPAAAVVVERLREALPEPTFAVETLHGYTREKAYIPLWDVGVDLVGVNTIEEKLDEALIKILVRSPNELIDVDHMLSRASEALADVAQVTHSALPKDSLLEISAMGVTKGSALAQLAADWDVDQSEVVAFGDNRNDVAMLKWAGLSWAMGNGHAAAIAAAKATADSISNDGVAKVLEELFA